MMLGNDIAAARARGVAASAGASHVADLARVGRGGKFPGNMHRVVLGKMLKGCEWAIPPVCIFNRKTGEHMIYIWLPHGLVHASRSSV